MGVWGPDGAFGGLLQRFPAVRGPISAARGPKLVTYTPALDPDGRPRIGVPTKMAWF